MNKKPIQWLAVALAMACSNLSHAGVSAEEAQKLKTTLTPVGAERAGNADGSIPAWNDVAVKVPPGYKSGERRPDPFPGEKPVQTITAKDIDANAARLSEGVKALLRKYPDSFRLEVYPSHRVATLPQWVNDNTFRNATSARTKNGGNAIEGAYGGIPFPIPKTGAEVMWNHLLTYVGPSTTTNYLNYTGTAEGKHVIPSKGLTKILMPYYDPKKAWTPNFSEPYMMMRVWQTDPPFKAGEALLIYDTLDRGRTAWQYLPGQRRVRKAPTIGYDTPDDINSGQQYFDEAFMFFGGLDRYDWKLVGKQEMYIPYSTNRWQNLPEEKQYDKHHINPDAFRWEKHRVWVVEATLAAGKRHVVPKRRYYLDEDTWAIVLSDGWDADGKIWRVGMSMPQVMLEGPFVLANQPWILYNLQAGTWVVGSPADFAKGPYYRMGDNLPATYFTPEALAGEGVR
ncbi:DUF1329 domain-containing protein [Duganella sp. BJB1802]|uniref:DUF1329 domain-containing protein n=1 Tax=Duganella sp. BJB1802 TaxID=2744575 RepID=UPI001593A950|nr:DUF1329 domain-containing protein [Duganella sp. BJB1802]NVD69598.1 DUF1329 domain-containing protein [Duganella sp. BJB1802]